MSSRVHRFRAELDQAGLAGSVVSRPEHVFYLSGFTSPPRGQSFLVVGPRGTALVARGDQERLQNAAGSDVSVFAYEFYRPTILREADDAAQEALAAALSQSGLAGHRFGVEEDHLPMYALEAIANTGDAIPLDGQIERMRLRKDDEEIAAIRRAVAINDLGFAAARTAIRGGATELDVFAVVFEAILRAHRAPFTLDGDFVSGPRTERIGGPATERELRRGDLVILDIYPVLNWYKGDFSRTFVVGAASTRQREIHRVLEEALAQGAALARAGIRACDVDAVVRETISVAGYGDYFPHHSGHAIGLGHPEPPFIIPADPTPLEPDMVITLEPGIYLPGFGGMRLEQNYLIREAGAEPLSTFPLELISCD